MELRKYEILMERLQKNLLDHTSALGKKADGASMQDVYKLQSLTNLHQYLTKHLRSENDIAALLCFADPLAVAHECLHRNTHVDAFPICEIIQEIKAYETFEQVQPLPEIQLMDRQRQMREELEMKLDREYDEYTDTLMGKSKKELIASSLEIASMQDVYELLRDGFDFRPTEIENLLKLEKPLAFLADNWFLPAEGNLLAFEEAHDIIKQLDSVIYKDSTRSKGDTNIEKPSVRSQLQAAKEEVRQQPPAQERPKGGEAR